MISLDQLNKHIKVLRLLEKYNINTPLVMCFRSPLDDTNNTRFLASLKSMIVVAKGSHRFGLPWIEKYLGKNELKKELEGYTGGPIIVFIAPKTKPLLHGVCTPHPYYNYVAMEDTPPRHIAWGENLKEVFNTETKEMAAYELNSALVLNKVELNGVPMRFTYHPKGEGTHGGKLVFWGSPIGG